MTDNGWNPMLWDCDEQGCFNKVCRPKIEVFAECFPGRINFTDVDAVVEIGGKFLLLEWKGLKSKGLKKGQQIMLERMTERRGFTAVEVVGDPITMEVQKIRVWSEGAPGEWSPCTLDDLKARIKAWADKAYATK